MGIESFAENMEINLRLKNKHFMGKEEMNHRQCFDVVIILLTHI